MRTIIFSFMIIMMASGAVIGQPWSFSTGSSIDIIDFKTRVRVTVPRIGPENVKGDVKIKIFKRGGFEVVIEETISAGVSMKEFDISCVESGVYAISIWESGKVRGFQFSK